MDKTIFYAPDILTDQTLPLDESAHCIRVLRKKEGDTIYIADGKGHFFDAEIVEAHQKHCVVNITNTINEPKPWLGNLHIAFAPTKNMDRVEWFAEKATEIGIDRFTPLLCRYSERKEIKLPRIEKILISAMKQSQKSFVPQLDEMTSFADFVRLPFDGQKLIAHCYPQEKKILKLEYKQGGNVLILIGPEGDFSEKEVQLALENGFEAISLGNSRLRTETAALVACNTIQVING